MVTFFWGNIYKSDQRTRLLFSGFIGLAVMSIVYWMWMVDSRKIIPDHVFVSPVTPGQVLEQKVLTEKITTAVPEDFAPTLTPEIPEGFAPKMTPREKELLLRLVDAFTSIMQESDIPFFMYSGTLLGSYRHHGLVPWDDDVDFVMPVDQHQNASDILQARLKPEFILSKEQTVRWKLSSREGSPIPLGSKINETLSWTFPFVDISFYYQNETHIYDYDDNHSDFIFPIDTVLPLTVRPFEGRYLPSPHDARAVISINYDLVQCKTGGWNHRTERLATNLSEVECRKLYHVFPFVERRGCEEIVRRNGTSYAWFVTVKGVC